MNKEFDCRYYSMCHRAYDLLYCPKKARNDVCIDYVSMDEYDASIRKNERSVVINYIEDHNDGRLKGLEDLMATPSEMRTESAQDIYLKEAYFELTLIKHVIDSLKRV